jgi:hypothetical protein
VHSVEGHVHVVALAAQQNTEDLGTVAIVVGDHDLGGAGRWCG